MCIRDRLTQAAIRFLAGIENKDFFAVFILFQQLINMRELILGKVYNPLLELFVHFSFDPRKVFPLFAYAGFGPGKADLQWKIQ